MLVSSVVNEPPREGPLPRPLRSRPEYGGFQKSLLVNGCCHAMRPHLTDRCFQLLTNYSSRAVMRSHGSDNVVPSPQSGLGEQKCRRSDQLASAARADRRFTIGLL